MVSMKIMGPLILGLYLAIVAFAQEDCIGDYNSTLCENSTCCETLGCTCDMSPPAILSNKERCLWVCEDNDECEESLSGTQCDTSNPSSGVCRFPCKDDSDCGSDGFCATEGELTAELCYPCTQGGGECNTSSPEWCCSGTCTNGVCAQDCIGDYNSTLCENSTCCETLGFTCDMSPPAFFSNKEKCLWVCKDNDECEESLSGTQCDISIPLSSVCRSPCKDDSDCGSDGFCATEGELTAGLCYPCTQDGGKCNTNSPEWCCSGTCNTDGKCAAKPSAGVSLFDRTFSPKLLVGFAVLMASAYFL